MSHTDVGGTGPSRVTFPRTIKRGLVHIRRLFRRQHPAKLALFGYLSYVAVGWAVLCLPICGRERTVGALDHLFTATSAVSTTGLITVSLADDYSFIGQIVVMILIQLGGIGYMTFGSFVILSRKGDLSAFRTGVARTVFSLPESFQIAKFVRSVIAFTLVIETAGAVALYILFVQRGVPDAFWSALFHSVSSFCTAGFSLYNNSFEPFQNDFWMNATIAVLSYLGAIGFIVCIDFWRVVRGKTGTMTLTSKIILWSTTWVSLIGVALLFLAEPSIQDKPSDERLLAAFFQTMTSLTTVGFNTISIGEMSKASLLVVVVLMIIGSSPSGTGGGLKCTTFSAIFGVMRSALRGEHQVRFWGKEVPLARVWTAVASLGFYLSALLIGTYLLELVEASPFDRNLFEAASALGTVGLSTGITASLTNMGKIVVILLMFCGRLGPLTFGMALFFKPYSEVGGDSDLAV